MENSEENVHVDIGDQRVNIDLLVFFFWTIIIIVGARKLCFHWSILQKNQEENPRKSLWTNK